MLKTIALKVSKESSCTKYFTEIYIYLHAHKIHLYPNLNPVNLRERNKTTLQRVKLMDVCRKKQKTKQETLIGRRLTRIGRTVYG